MRRKAAARYVRVLYHGGRFDYPSGTGLWATPDFDYAAAFAEMYEAVVWALSVDLADSDILDLTVHGFDAKAVAAALTDAGMWSMVPEEDKEQPLCAVRRVPDQQVRAAGYRAVRMWESIDWGAGRRRTQSLRLVDLSAIVRRDALPLPDGVSFQRMTPDEAGEASGSVALAPIEAP